MRIRGCLKNQTPALSFEFYPPEGDIGFRDLYRIVESLRPPQPTYVSVTYGTGGTTRRRTLELVARIKSDAGSERMAHLTCQGANAHEQQDYVSAKQWYRKTIMLIEKLGIEHETERTYHSLGAIAFAQGDFAAAEQWYRKAVAIFEKQDTAYGAAQT
jgi:hypothetical protein